MRCALHSSCERLRGLARAHALARGRLVCTRARACGLARACVIVGCGFASRRACSVASGVLVVSTRASGFARVLVTRVCVGACSCAWDRVLLQPVLSCAMARQYYCSCTHSWCKAVDGKEHVDERNMPQLFGLSRDAVQRASMLRMLRPNGSAGSRPRFTKS